MESSRVKMRIGAFEFEAEGAPEVVQQQLDAFKELMLAHPSAVNRDRQYATEARDEDEPTPPVGIPVSHGQVRLENILHADGRVISLTALPSTVEEASLLIMLGQKELRSNVSATGQEIGDGLEQSGKPAERVDRIMAKHIREALVMKTGLGRATRYRLTNQGMSRALSIARELISTLPSA